MRSPRWLRRTAIPIALLGIVQIASAAPAWSIHFRHQPLEQGLANLFFFVCTGLWILASGFVLGFLAEADRIGEEWAAPFARGVTNFLAVGGILGMALMWSNPMAWILCILSVVARLFARKPNPLMVKSPTEDS